MGVVTVHAVIANPGPLSQIPVARPAAVGAMVVVTSLGSVTLATQRHWIAVRYARSVRETQGAVVDGVVARGAGKSTVCEHQALVELIEILGREHGSSGAPLVAGGARDRSAATRVLDLDAVHRSRRCDAHRVRVRVASRLTAQRHGCRPFDPVAGCDPGDESENSHGEESRRETSQSWEFVRAIDRAPMTREPRRNHELALSALVLR